MKRKKLTNGLAEDRWKDGPEHKPQMMGQQVDKILVFPKFYRDHTQLNFSAPLHCKRVYKFEADILHFALRGFRNTESEIRGEESSLLEHSGSAVQEVKSRARLDVPCYDTLRQSRVEKGEREEAEGRRHCRPRPRLGE